VLGQRCADRWTGPLDRYCGDRRHPPSMVVRTDGRWHRGWCGVPDRTRRIVAAE
jgi:hypothetical protein